MIDFLWPFGGFVRVAGADQLGEDGGGGRAATGAADVDEGGGVGKAPTAGGGEGGGEVAGVVEVEVGVEGRRGGGTDGLMEDFAGLDMGEGTGVPPPAGLRFFPLGAIASEGWEGKKGRKPRNGRAHHDVVTSLPPNDQHLPRGKPSLASNSSLRQALSTLAF